MAYGMASVQKSTLTPPARYGLRFGVLHTHDLNVVVKHSDLVSVIANAQSMPICAHPRERYLLNGNITISVVTE